jgi:hypothetical protein
LATAAAAVASAAGRHQHQTARTDAGGAEQTWLQLPPSPPLSGQRQALGVVGGLLVPLASWPSCGGTTAGGYQQYVVRRGDFFLGLASPSGGAEMGSASSGAERGDDDDAVFLALANACGKYGSGWSGCLGLKKPREDPRAKDVGGHSTKRFGLHQPSPSPDSPSSVTRSSTAATTPRPPARHALEDLFDQAARIPWSAQAASAVDSESDGIDYQAGGGGGWNPPGPQALPRLPMPATGSIYG